MADPPRKVKLKCRFDSEIRVVMLAPNNANYAQMKKRLNADYGFEVSLKYEDTEGDLIMLSSQNDLDDLMSSGVSVVNVVVTEALPSLLVGRRAVEDDGACGSSSRMPVSGTLLIPPQSASSLAGASMASSNRPSMRLSSSHADKFPSVPQHSFPARSIRWKKGEILGQGAFGIVYLGLDIDTGGLMAVKQLELAEVSSKELASLENEIELLKTLSHPNIVRYIGTEVTAQALTIFLEYVPGGSLRTLIEKFGALEESVARSYTRQLLLGLEYLHRNGIAHRDIKGGNCLVGNDGVIKLADFGASKYWRSTQSVVANATGGGTPTRKSEVPGTPQWMAPEVVRGEVSATGDINWKKADIWSLGCTVIEMTTGKSPWFQFTNPVTVLYHIACSEILPTFPEKASIEIQTFLNICLQRNPQYRPDISSLLLHPFVANVTVGPSAMLAMRPSTVSHATGSAWTDGASDNQITRANRAKRDAKKTEIDHPTPAPFDIEQSVESLDLEGSNASLELISSKSIVPMEKPVFQTEQARDLGDLALLSSSFSNAQHLDIPEDPIFRQSDGEASQLTEVEALGMIDDSSMRNRPRASSLDELSLDSSAQIFDASGSAVALDSEFPTPKLHKYQHGVDHTDDSDSINIPGDSVRNEESISRVKEATKVRKKSAAKVKSNLTKPDGSADEDLNSEAAKKKPTRVPSAVRGRGSRTKSTPNEPKSPLKSERRRLGDQSALPEQDQSKVEPKGLVGIILEHQKILQVPDDIASTTQTELGSPGYEADARSRAHSIEEINEDIPAYATSKYVYPMNQKQFMDDEIEEDIDSDRRELSISMDSKRRETLSILSPPARPHTMNELKPIECLSPKSSKQLQALKGPLKVSRKLMTASSDNPTEGLFDYDQLRIDGRLTAQSRAAVPSTATGVPGQNFEAARTLNSRVNPRDKVVPLSAPARRDLSKLRVDGLSSGYAESLNETVSRSISGMIPIPKVSHNMEESMLPYFDFSKGPDVLSEHTGSVTRMRMARRCRLLVSASIDCTVRIWGAGMQSSRAVLNAGDSRFESTVDGDSSSKLLRIQNVWADSALDVVWGACVDGSLRLWQGQEGRPLRLIKAHEEAVTAVEGMDESTTAGYFSTAGDSISGNNQLVASGSLDRSVKLWDPRAKRPLVNIFRGHGDSIMSVKWSLGGRELISASKDKTIRIWDLRTGRARATIEKHFGAVTNLKVIPPEIQSGSMDDGLSFVSVGRDSMLHGWSLSGQCMGSQAAHRGPISCISDVVTNLSYLPTASQGAPIMLSSGASDGVTKLWDLRRMKVISEVRTQFETEPSLSKVVWLGDSFIGASTSGSIRIWAHRSSLDSVSIVDGEGRGDWVCRQIGEHAFSCTDLLAAAGQVACSSKAGVIYRWTI